MHFEARQRGTENDPGQNNLWKQEPVAKATWDATPRTQADHIFQFGLKHSLGYLNQPFGDPQVSAATGEKGLPANPFPWLTSNNRPFVSPLELLLVPTCSSSKLLVNAGTAASSHDTTDAELQQVLQLSQDAQPIRQPTRTPCPL